MQNMILAMAPVTCPRVGFIRNTDKCCSQKSEQFSAAPAARPRCTGTLETEVAESYAIKHENPVFLQESYEFAISEKFSWHKRCEGQWLWQRCKASVLGRAGMAECGPAPDPGIAQVQKLPLLHHPPLPAPSCKPQHAAYLSLP